MTLAEISERLGLKVLAGAPALGRDVSGGYAGDLLSDVMANCQKGQVWITIQGHINTVAVGTLKELTGIILVNGRSPAADALAKADQEGLPILSTDMSAFDLSGRIYSLLTS